MSSGLNKGWGAFVDWRRVAIVAVAAGLPLAALPFVVDEFVRHVLTIGAYYTILSVSWNLVKGQAQRAQRGRYLLEPQGDDATKVTYTLSVQLMVPMIGLFRRKAEKVIMDIALKDLKRRAEGL